MLITYDKHLTVTSVQLSLGELQNISPSWFVLNLLLHERTRSDSRLQSVLGGLFETIDLLLATELVNIHLVCIFLTFCSSFNNKFKY